MPLENNPQVPDDLDAAWPTGSDDIGQGDNHIRNVKQVIKNLDIEVRADLALPDGATKVGTSRTGNPDAIVSTVQADLDELRADKVNLVGDETISDIKTFAANPLLTGPQVDTDNALVKKVTLDDAIETALAPLAGGPPTFVSEVTRPVLYSVSDPIVGQEILGHVSIPPNALVFIDVALELVATRGSVTPWWRAALVTTAQAPGVTDPSDCNIQYKIWDEGNTGQVNLTSGQIVVQSDDNGEMIIKWLEVGLAWPSNAILTLRVAGVMPLYVPAP